MEQSDCRRSGKLKATPEGYRQFPRRFVRQNPCADHAIKALPQEEAQRRVDMAKTRVNPDTGVIETQDGFFESILDVWTPKED